MLIAEGCVTVWRICAEMRPVRGKPVTLEQVETPFFTRRANFSSRLRALRALRVKSGFAAYSGVTGISEIKGFQSHQFSLSPETERKSRATHHA